MVSRRICLILFCRFFVTTAQVTRIRNICSTANDVVLSCKTNEKLFIKKEYYGIKHAHLNGTCSLRPNDCYYYLPTESDPPITGNTCNERTSCRIYMSQLENMVRMAIRKMQHQDKNCNDLVIGNIAIKIQYQCIEDYLIQDICEGSTGGSPRPIYLLGRQGPNVCNCKASGKDLQITALQVTKHRNSALTLTGNSRNCTFIDENEGKLYDKDIVCGSSVSEISLMADFVHSPSSIIWLQVSGSGTIQYSCWETKSDTVKNIDTTTLTYLNENSDNQTTSTNKVDVVLNDSDLRMGIYISIAVIAGCVVLSCIICVLIRRHRERFGKEENEEPVNETDENLNANENSYTYIDCNDSDYSSMTPKTNDVDKNQDGYHEILLSAECGRTEHFNKNYDHLDDKISDENGVYNHLNDTHEKHIPVINSSLYDHVKIGN